VEHVSFVSRSAAELRIKPMLSCIGDIDLMHAQNYFISIPHGHEPPIKLPGHYARVMRALWTCSKLSTVTSRGSFT